MLVLAVITLVSIVFAIVLFNKVIELNKEVDKAKQDLNKTKEDAQELVEIETGDNAIVPGYGLSTKGTDSEKPVSFTVTYEVEIVEVSVDSVKVKAVDYRSHDSYANDPVNKQAILNFINGSWLKRHEVEILMDEKKKRSIKLNQLGI
jgi:type II secretory pathway pseudopilin PulG